LIIDENSQRTSKTFIYSFSTNHSPTPHGYS
jgi:hypothetical protein